jgi:hypothetical protein
MRRRRRRYPVPGRVIRHHLDRAEGRARHLGFAPAAGDEASRILRLESYLALPPGPAEVLERLSVIDAQITTRGA